MKFLSFGKGSFQKVKQKKKVNPKNEKIRVIEKAPIFAPIDLSDESETSPQNGDAMFANHLSTEI